MEVQMITYKALDKILNKYGRRVGFRVADKEGNILDLSIEDIKKAMLTKRADFVNLKLTADNKLIMLEPKNKLSKSEQMQISKIQIHALYLEDSIEDYLEYGVSKNVYPTVTILIPFVSKEIKDSLIKVVDSFNLKGNYSWFSRCCIAKIEYLSLMKNIAEGKVILDNVKVVQNSEKDIQRKINKAESLNNSKSYINKYKVILLNGEIREKKESSVCYNKSKNLKGLKVDKDKVWKVLEDVHRITNLDISKPSILDKNISKKQYTEKFDDYCNLFIDNLKSYSWYNLGYIDREIFNNSMEYLIKNIYKSDRLKTYNEWIPYSDDTFMDCIAFIIMYYGKDMLNSFESMNQKEELINLGLNFNNLTKYAELFRYAV